MRSFLDHAPELARDVEIQGITAVAIDALPLHAIAELLGTGDEFDRHVLLARADKDCDVEVVAKAAEIHLLHVLEIDQQ